MRFCSGLHLHGTDFFDLMTRQMLGIHDTRDLLANAEGKKADKDFSLALDGLKTVGTDRGTVADVENAVSGLLAITEEELYKQGFSDAICMILQAAMHGK